MASKRLPLSCENCRQRKIRCISSRYSAPCDTCARRGYASSCRFRRQDSHHPTHSSELGKTMGNVSALEDLLRQNIALSTALLGQRKDTRLPSPVSSPAASHHGIVQSPSEPDHGHQAGRLIVSPSNHIQFVPSSDIGDSDLINTMHESTPGCPTGFPFFDQPGPSPVSDELLDMLPPLPQLEELTSTYFRVFSPLFHILHDPTFHARYEEFKQNPKSVTLSFLALLFVILSLSVTALDDVDPLLIHLGRDPSPGANIRSLSAKYRGAAMRCLTADNFMFRHNLCTVQCLVLLIYALNHAQGPAWSLLGTTLHIAVAIGCAVDPARLNVNPIEAEERRRCWAALQMLYTIQNTCLGNLMPFRIDSHVDLPADIEDEDLLSPSGFTAASNDLLDPASAPPTKMTYLLYKFRLYHLAFDICQLSSQTRSQFNPAKIAALDNRITYEQQCHSMRFAAGHFHQLEPYHQAHYYILANYTNHLTLLLHRPCLSTAEGTGPTAFESKSLHSAERCEHAAVAILSNYAKLSADPIFRMYRWYVDGLGSFFAFFSITTLLVLHGNENANGHLHSHHQYQNYRRHNPTNLNLVLRCIEIIVANASRSAICAKAAAILEPVTQRLSSVIVVGAGAGAGAGAGSIVGDVHPSPSSSIDQGCHIVQSVGSTSHDLRFSHRPDQAQDQELVWSAFPELGSLFFNVPSEQWLSPAGFPWVGA